MAIIAGYAYGYGFQTLYCEGNSYKTLINLNNHQFVFRLVIFLFVIILILDVVVAWGFYLFFKQVNKNLALLSAWLRLAYTAFLSASLTPLVIVLFLLKKLPQNKELIMNCLNAFLSIWSIGLIVFACHLLLLGYLVLQYRFIPKVFGVLTFFAGICYLFSNATPLLFANFEQNKHILEAILSLPMAAGELGLAFWLLCKGGKTNLLNL